MSIMFKRFWQFTLAAAFAAGMTGTWGQSVTVIEYYNKALDAYFISGRTAEQQSLDALSDFQRTGMSFQAVAASTASSFNTKICRFYINTTSPFASTHFYGREGTDCEQLRVRNLSGFTWEDYDFALEQPVNGVCPATTVTVYRSFRPAANGKTANHRYSTSSASYAASISAGYSGEQAAFCATAATDVTPVLSAICGTFYYPGVRVSYQSLSDKGVPNSWVRFNGISQTPFNGVQATPVVDRYASGQNQVTYIAETLDSWSTLGTDTDDLDGTHDSYYSPPTLHPRRMAFGQRININRDVAFNPGQGTGNATQTGHLMLVGVENVTVDSGIYSAACKYSTELTTTYPTISRTVVRRATTWVVQNVGIVKSSIQETTTTGSASPTVSTSEVQAVSVQPL
jgi:hypothetical protein